MNISSNLEKENATGQNQLGVNANRPVHVLTASSIIGDNVENLQGESIGKIKEIMLNLKDGRVQYLVIEFGGFMGFGEKLFAVPFSALKLNTINKDFVLNIEIGALNHQSRRDAKTAQDGDAGEAARQRFGSGNGKGLGFGHSGSNWGQSEGLAKMESRALNFFHTARNQKAPRTTHPSSGQIASRFADFKQQLTGTKSSWFQRCRAARKCAVKALISPLFCASTERNSSRCASASQIPATPTSTSNGLSPSVRTRKSISIGVLPGPTMLVATTKSPGARSRDDVTRKLCPE